MMSLKTNLLLLLLIGLILVGLGWFEQYADARVVIPPEAIAQKVKAHILETTELDDEKASLVVEMLRLPMEPIELEGDNLDIFVEDHRVTPIPYRTIVQLTLTTDIDNEHIGVPVKVMVEKPVWVTKKMIRAKSKLTKADLVQKRQRLDHNEGYALMAYEDVSNYVASVNLAPGTVLDVRQVKTIPAVKANEPINIIIKLSSGIQLKTTGTALQNGAVGDEIRVKQQTRDRKTKIYSGQVIRNRTILVTL